MGQKAPHALIDTINPNILAIKLRVNGLTVVMKRQTLSYGFLKNFRRHLKGKEINV